MPVRHRHGPYYVGSSDEVIDKILFQHELFRHQRLMLYLGGPHLDHALKLRAIELLGTQVAPVVRSEIARRTAFIA